MKARLGTNMTSRSDNSLFIEKDTRISGKQNQFSKNQLQTEG